MDLSFLQELIPNVAGFFNLPPESLMLFLIVVSSTANIIARRIPDDQTGWKGVVRDVCSILGLYTQNRVSAGVKTGDVIKGIVHSRVERKADGKLQTLELEEVVPAPVAEAIEDEMKPTPAPVPAFPGLINRKIEDYPEELN